VIVLTAREQKYVLYLAERRGETIRQAIETALRTQYLQAKTANRAMKRPEVPVGQLVPSVAGKGKILKVMP
jgi:hypothetical protein